MKDAVTERIQHPTESDDSVRTLLKRMYHVPVLVALMVVMLATRLRALENFRSDGGFSFRGNDPWYHFRETSYLLDNFPSTMPFDPMTNYPAGTSSDQFGTLYDQIVSGFILLTSLGDPSPEYAGLIMLIAAPVFVVAAVVPTYLIAARFAGRGPALAGIVVLGLLPGTVLNYSLVGFYDHHAAEVFFQTLGVFGFVAALSIAQQTQPVWELVVDRDVEALRRPLLYSVAAGIGAALYMWAWPPGILLVGFTGIFFAVKLTSEVYHERSPEPIAFVGTVSMIVTGLLMFVPLTNYSLTSSTSHSLLQVILPLGVAAGCVFLSVLARVWESRDIDFSLYPVAVGSILLVLAGVFSSFAQRLTNSLLNRVGFSSGATARTVGEAQPFLSNGSAFDVIYSEYGLALFTAIVAAIVLLARPLVRSDDIKDTGYVVGALVIVGLIYLATPALSSIAGLVGLEWQVLGLFIVAGLLVGATFRHRYDAVELYLLVWAAFITSAAFTQVRFNYYLAIVVAVFSAVFVGQTLGYIQFETAGTIKASARNIKGWQVMVAVTVFLVLTAPLLFPFAGSAWASGDRNGPGTISQWDDTFEWMSTETPQPGELGGADNAMGQYDTYERPADGNFDYPDGSYGVQSWWDYGHWITTNGERIPNANPFQQGAGAAANYLLAPTEQQAADALDRKMGDDGQTRYVVVDWQMVSPNSKFGAPVVFYNDGDVSQSDFVNRAYPLTQTQQGQRFGAPVTLRSQRYYDSQMNRLYHYHGSAADPDPIVIETEPQTAQTQSGRQVTVDTFNAEEDIRGFETLSEAETYVSETPGAQLGGIGANPTERVEALEHYRLVKASQSNAVRTSRGYRQQLFQTAQSTGINLGNLIRTTPHWVKTFERVPGATVEGSGAAPGQEVSATVEMAYPEEGGTFSYTQYATADENGNFEMTLPYSTTGYDEFGPENGYTNTSVQATGQYSFSGTTTTGDDLITTQRVAQANVTEAQVVGADDSTVTVELTQQTVDVPEGAQTAQASS